MNFKEIMEFNSPYNQRNFDKLVQDIQSNKIVPYIGAGMSMLFEGTYPSWGAFLNETFNEFMDISEKSQFDNLSYEEKANYLYEDIAKITFAEHLKSVFGEEHLNKGRQEFTNKPIYLLPTIFDKGLIITTNYDKVIEKIYELHESLLSVLHPGHYEALNSAIRDNKLLLYKIHGDINEPMDSIILTKNQYDEAYKNQNLVETLKQIYTSKGMLFLGCSIEKDRPIELLCEVSKSGMYNYAIISCKDENVKDRRKELENDYYTKSIIYPDGKHECLNIILDNIAKTINTPKYQNDMPEFKLYEKDELNFNIPFNRNLNFIGRENIIDLLSSSLEEKNIQILSGMSGVGKTQIAIEYTYKNIDKYDYIFWINSENNITLFNDYISIGRKLDIIDESNKNQELHIKEVDKWLSLNNRWLLVFDNCEDYDQVYNYIPRGGKGDIIITAQNPNWNNLNKSIKVELFTEDESVDFFKKKIDMEIIDDIKILSDKLGYLPLALNQAASYIEETGINVKDYIKLYDEYNLRIFEKSYNKEEYSHTVKSVWKISLDKIKEKSEIATYVMKLLGLFSNTKIPKSLIENNLEKLSDVLTKKIDLLELNEVISILNRYALINVDREYYSMHCIIQMVIRNELKEKNEITEYTDRLSMYFYDILPNHIDQLNNSLKIEDLIPHVNFIINSIETPNEIYMELRYKFGVMLRTNAQYNDAKSLLQESLELIEILNKEYEYKDINNLINTKNLLAGILKDIGELDNALNYYFEIQEIIKYDCSSNGVMGTINNNIGLIYKDKGKYERAKIYFEEAIKYYTYEEKNVKRNLATTLTNLSDVNLKLGKYSDAIENIDKSLDIISIEYGVNNLQYGRALNNKANILMEKGKYQQAIDLYEEAIEIDKGIYGSNNPEILTKQSNLILCKCGLTGSKCSNLENELKDIISRNIDIFGESHIAVAKSLYALSDIYIIQGRYDEAFKSLMEIKDKYIKYYTKFNYIISELNMRLSKCLINIGGADNINLAIDLYSEVLEIDKNIEESDRIMDDLVDITSVLESVDNYDAAIDNIKNIIDFIIDKYGQFSSELGYVYLYLSYLHLQSKNYIDAIDYYSKYEECKIDIIENEFDDKFLGLYSLITKSTAEDFIKIISENKLELIEDDNNLIIKQVSK